MIKKLSKQLPIWALIITMLTTSGCSQKKESGIAYAGEASEVNEIIEFEEPEPQELETIKTPLVWDNPPPGDIYNDARFAVIGEYNRDTIFYMGKDFVVREIYDKKKYWIEDLQGNIIFPKIIGKSLHPSVDEAGELGYVKAIGSSNGKSALYTKNGKEILPLNYDSIEIYGDFAVVTKEIAASTRSGIYNMAKGKFILPINETPKEILYERPVDISYWQDGIFSVSRDAEHKEGETIDIIRTFYNEDGFWFILNESVIRNGKVLDGVIILDKYEVYKTLEGAYSTKSGHLEPYFAISELIISDKGVEETEGKVGLMDAKGNIILQPIYNNVVDVIDDNTFVVGMGGAHTIDREGNIIFSLSDSEFMTGYGFDQHVYSERIYEDENNDIYNKYSYRGASLFTEKQGITTVGLRNLYIFRDEDYKGYWISYAGENGGSPDQIAKTFDYGASAYEIHDDFVILYFGAEELDYITYENTEYAIIDINTGEALVERGLFKTRPHNFRDHYMESQTTKHNLDRLKYFQEGAPIHCYDDEGNLVGIYDMNLRKLVMLTSSLEDALPNLEMDRIYSGYIEPKRAYFFEAYYATTIVNADGNVLFNYDDYIFIKEVDKYGKMLVIDKNNRDVEYVVELNP